MVERAEAVLMQARRFDVARLIPICAIKAMMRQVSIGVIAAMTVESSQVLWNKD